MINIISTQAQRAEVTGPYKVFVNLTKGLQRLRYPFVVNRELSATSRLWIHDDIAALRCMRQSRARKVVGPNLFVMPEDIPSGIRFDEALYLQPCDWAARMWQIAGFGKCPLRSWPVGIDTDEFAPSSTAASGRRVMVYHKMRDPHELPLIFDALRDLRLPSWLVLYQQYSEKEYKELLGQTSFVLWHGRAESQGIALQEAMAANVPILVWDVTSVKQTRGGYPFDASAFDFQVTAAPYFDDTCGIRFSAQRELRASLERMQDTWQLFRPREYVLKNLSLEGQARAFVALWETWDLTFEEGLREHPTTRRGWYGPSPIPQLGRRAGRKLRFLLADSAKRIGLVSN